MTVESEAYVYTGLTSNLSDGGVFVAMAAPPAVGSIVRLHVHLGDGQEVLVAGQVRWQRTDAAGTVDGVGMQFLGMDAAAAAALSALMARAGKAVQTVRSLPDASPDPAAQGTGRTATRRSS